MEAVAVEDSASVDCAEPAGNTVVAGNIAPFVMHTLASFGDTVGFRDWIVQIIGREFVQMFEHSEP